MNDEEHVVLVDGCDRAIGVEDKLVAHQQGKRHRAFSVFVFRDYQGVQQLLIQKRHRGKYHCGGLWSNTCCSHPRSDEDVILAGERRLVEEVAIHAKLRSMGWFHYIAVVDNGLIENEIDHVLVGVSHEGKPLFDHQEVEECQWVDVATLQTELMARPQCYTPWFKQALEIAVRG